MFSQRPIITISVRKVFPASIRSRRVQMHLFDGYWEDIGTIKSFFECNLALAKNPAPFELASSESPIYTRARFLPPSRIDNATISNSLISDGCIIESGAVIENSVLGLPDASWQKRRYQKLNYHGCRRIRIA